MAKLRKKQQKFVLEYIKCNNIAKAARASGYSDRYARQLITKKHVSDYYEEEKNKHVVAVIGDGAMTAGMAFEALNHAGSLDANLLVILNDNDMSISPNVGGLSNYLAKVLSSKLYVTAKEGSKKIDSIDQPCRFTHSVLLL